MKETKKCSRREFMRLDGAFEVALRDITGLHRNIPTTETEKEIITNARRFRGERRDLDPQRIVLNWKYLKYKRARES